MSIVYQEVEYGNAERVHPHQARPEDDTAVAVLRDIDGRKRYIRCDFDDNGGKEGAILRAKELAWQKVNIGWEFIAGHVGYLARETGEPDEKCKDYTRTGEWTLK